jgi:hypothetical protein
MNADRRVGRDGVVDEGCRVERHVGQSFIVYADIHSVQYPLWTQPFDVIDEFGWDREIQYFVLYVTQINFDNDVCALPLRLWHTYKPPPQSPMVDKTLSLQVSILSLLMPRAFISSSKKSKSNVL